MNSNTLNRSEEAFNESEELTQTILDFAFDAIFSMDAQGKITDWNKRAETILGWRADQIIGKTLSETIIPHRYRELHTKGLELFLESGKSKVLSQQIEITALHHDGHEIPVELSISVIKRADFIFTGILRDISKRTRALKLAQHRTEEFEVLHETAKGLNKCDSMNNMLKGAMKTITKFRAFNFEKMAGGFLTKNGKDFFLVSHIGEFKKNFYEIANGWLLTNGISLMDLGSEKGSVKHFCLINTAQSNGCSQQKDKGLYIVPLKRNIRIIGLLILFPSEETSSYERNKNILISIGGLVANAIQHYQCEEIVKKQNEQLTAANKKLKELNKLKNEFLGIASHDLRNPLYLIGAYSEILKNEFMDKANESGGKIAEKISTSAQFMRSLLDNLLDISIIESGKYRLKKCKVNLNTLVEHQVETFKIISKKKNIKIALDQGENHLVHCDRNAMIQVVGNFISNAIKFSPANSKINVRIANHVNGIRFSVKDDGPGISQEEQKLLFREFQTLSTKPTGGEKSTGLGLLIVKKLITLHNGKVGVSSEPGKGSTFWFDLPTFAGNKGSMVRK